jgi:hypothetical protein
MDFGAISWSAVLLGGLAFFAVGALWYGALFSKPWLRAVGIDPDAPGGNVALTFGGTLVLELAAAVGLAAVIGADATVGRGLALGVAVGVLLACTTLAVQYLYERRPPILWAINLGHTLVGFAAMGAVIGALQ